MVNLRVVPFDAAAQGMFAMVPTQVRAGYELLVAEQERVGRLGIAQGRAYGVAGPRRRLANREDEAGKSVIQGWVTRSSRIVGSRDIQILESFGRGEIKRRRGPATP